MAIGYKELNNINTNEFKVIMRAADALISTVLASGTDTIFSLSGNQIMSIYDAAIDQPINLIHTRHEAGAVYMADGYARSTGKTGIALVTAAPGFTNALGPLFAIKATETPLVLISGDSPVAKDDLMPFQRLDQTLIAQGLVKESWRITKADRLADDLAGAIALAHSGRPGPIHLSVPQDVLEAKVKDPAPFDPEQFQPETMALSKADLPSILSIIDQAEYPLIITGPSQHESRQRKAVQDLMAALSIPVITMQSPRGLNDPAMGRIKDVLAKADCIILIDKDVDFTLAAGDLDHVPAESFILITSQSESIAHASTVLSGRLQWGCLADPITAMTALTQANTIKGDPAWCRFVQSKIKDRPKPPKSNGGMTAYDVMDAIGQQTAESDPIFVIDGGEVGQWAQSVLPLDNALTNGISGAIGGSLPQAIGVAMANPDRHVIAIMGDGTAGFYLSELDTARRLGLKLTVIVANDLRWGAEVVIQERLYGADRVAGCLLDEKTRYDQIAKGFGANGILAETLDQFETGLAKALKSRKPTVINALIKGMPAPSF